ncbi:MAG: UDP-3-O-acyl-N-acetylglucosamine deacetylase [Rickettsiales bacterium]|jgi:UDP-3-O-[3-hydroxymyristoyl] N-acetylglucosamine deacetylase|nr:UDP-3-O-acyl-N-acetylglucosamine deacetylase [Rickettsiales bacterium]
MRQNTIKDKISFEGVGLHSGELVQITLEPAPENTGIVFVRENDKIPALYNKVSNTMLGTTIADKSEVLTIEHLMASMWSSGIDNVYIKIDNKETPIMDGSAMLFIQEIQKAGIQEQDANRKFLVIKKDIVYQDNKKLLKITPSDDFNIDMEIDFNYGGIGRQTYFFDGREETFVKEIAFARTFCNFAEIENMKKIGFAKGGYVDLVEDINQTKKDIPLFFKIFNLFKKTKKQDLSEIEKLVEAGKIIENAAVYDDNKILNKSGLRCKDEVVRHKLLDLVGDLYTSGYHIKGSVKAVWSGHTVHNKFLQLLFSDKNNYAIEE